TLELGGKSPVLISDSADLAEVARKVLFAKTLNAGQICLAPDYLMIAPQRVEPLVAQLHLAARELFPAGIDSPDYVNIISERHASRLRGHLEDARARGNTVIALLAD